MKRCALSTVIWLCLAACDQPEAGECVSDGDCSPGFRCDSATRACQCAGDASCPIGRVCNAYGACQPRAACHGNQDCAPGFICNASDPGGGACIAADACGSSVHCPFNTYCDAASRRCVSGCVSTGDCQLGYVCRDGSCLNGQGGADCVWCPTDLDATTPRLVNSYCDYGEVCVDGACTAHSLQPLLCQDCTGACPDGLVCVVDRDDPNQSYCAPQCQSEVDCPSGFSGCSALVLLLQACPINSWCTNGLPCVYFSETSTSLCQCVGDQECGPAPACDNGICQGVGARCNDERDCASHCAPQGAGELAGNLCQTAYRVCRKDRGITCADMLTGVAPCAR